MLIVNTPVCPHCTKCVLTRKFTTTDKIAMGLCVFLFFPLAIWIYLNPDFLYCQSCGAELSERPV